MMLTMRTKGEHFMSNENKLGLNSESLAETLIVKVLTFQASSIAITKLGLYHPGENGKCTSQSKDSEHKDEAMALSTVWQCFFIDSISVGLAPMSFLSLPPTCLLLT
jgi:hypothetical protein